MTRVATAANEPTLLELARLSTAHQLEQVCRKYATVQRHDADVRPKDDAERRYVSRRDTADGMVRIEVVLCSEEAGRVLAACSASAETRVDGLVEAFNLTDRVNPITRNTTFGSGSYPSNPVSPFNTVTAVGDPRSIQFGVRLTF